MRHRSIAELIPSFEQVEPIFVADDPAEDIAPVDIPSFLPKEPREPTIDVDAVFEAGRQAGLQEANQHLARALADAQAEATQALDAARRVWVAAEGEALASLIHLSLSALEDRIAEQVGRLLVPVLAQHARAAAIAALRGQIAPLLMGDDAPAIRIDGPADLLQALRDQLDDHPRLAFHVSAATEVSVTLGETDIKTRIGDWAARLDAVSRAEKK